MPRHKLTFEFDATVGSGATSGSKAGWSESWYMPTDEADSVATTKANSLLGARLGVLTPGWSCTAIRLSRLNAAFQLERKGRLIFVAPADGVGRYPGANQDEQPYDALEISVGSAAGNRRNFQLRGIPNSIVNAGGRFTPTAAWSGPRDTYFAYLTGAPLPGDFGNPGPLALRIRDLGTDGVVENVWIGGNSPAPATPISPLVLVNEIAGIAADALIDIHGVQGLKGLNGTWIIDSVQLAAAPLVGSLLSLRPKRRKVISGTFVQAGTFRTWRWLLDNVSILTEGYGTSRRTGRPSQLPRGRRSNRDS